MVCVENKINKWKKQNLLCSEVAKFVSFKTKIAQLWTILELLQMDHIEQKKRTMVIENEIEE